MDRWTLSARPSASCKRYMDHFLCVYTGDAPIYSGVSGDMIIGSSSLVGYVRGLLQLFGVIELVIGDNAYMVQ